MTNPSEKLVSIIVPCHNEEASVAPFLERTRAAADQAAEFAFEFLFVDDGSQDATKRRVIEASQADPRVKLVSLSRNFGHQRAISAGLDFCSGDYVIVIDADLQDPPEMIPRIIERLEEGSDLVHMVRESRAVDSFAKRASARIFYAFMRRYVLPELTPDAPDYKGFNRRVLKAMRLYRERVRFMRGMLATLGFNQTELRYVREERHSGVTKYRGRNILRLCRDAIVSYSVIPIRLSFFAGILTALAGILVFLASGLVHFCGQGLDHPLLAIVIGLQLLLTGAVLTVLGLIGEYLGCIIREVKQRPLYLVESTHNLVE
ncbi:MAG: glycosyltransferase [Nitrospiraceae bacterium]|nr:glycosyltransferase [Nitrospiraceae bacterium]